MLKTAKNTQIRSLPWIPTAESNTSFTSTYQRCCSRASPQNLPITPKRFWTWMMSSPFKRAQPSSILLGLPYILGTLMTLSSTQQRLPRTNIASLMSSRGLHSSTWLLDSCRRGFMRKLWNLLKRLWSIILGVGRLIRIRLSPLESWLLRRGRVNWRKRLFRLEIILLEILWFLLIWQKKSLMKRLELVLMIRLNLKLLLICLREDL